MNAILEHPRTREFSLLLLRISTGFLLIWWGLAKANNAGYGNLISDKFYGGLFSLDTLQLGFGWFQVLVGAAVVVGLARRWVYPVQLVINAFTAASVWYAIIDPFKWYLPPQTDFAFTQLFYPSAIIFAASLLLPAFRRQDRWAVDELLGEQSATDLPGRASTALR